MEHLILVNSLPEFFKNVCAYNGSLEREMTEGRSSVHSTVMCSWLSDVIYVKKYSPSLPLTAGDAVTFEYADTARNSGESLEGRRMYEVSEYDSMTMKLTLKTTEVRNGKLER